MPAVQEPTRTGRTTKQNFVVSLLLHAVLLGGLLGSAFVFHKSGESWGDKTDVSGAVQATMVNSVPLPPKVQPTTDNVLASESPSEVPPPPKPAAEPPPKPTDIPVVVKQPDKKQPQGRGDACSEAGGTSAANQAAARQGCHRRDGRPARRHDRRGESRGDVLDQRDRLRFWTAVRVLRSAANAEGRAAMVHANAGQRRAGPPRVPSAFVWSATVHHRRSRSPSPAATATLDASAMRALQRIDTFGPLPDGYSGQYINVQYYFDPKQ